MSAGILLSIIVLANSCEDEISAPSLPESIVAKIDTLLTQDNVEPLMIGIIKQDTKESLPSHTAIRYKSRDRHQKNPVGEILLLLFITPLDSPKSLMKMQALEQFALVGGTNLLLRLGHRMGIDFAVTLIRV